MRISPVLTNNLNKKQTPRTVYRPPLITPSFTGKDEFVKPVLWGNIKKILSKSILPLGGLAGIGTSFQESFESRNEQIDLYLKLNGHFITPEVFYDLYYKSPGLAKALVNSERKVYLGDIDDLLDITQYKFTDEQYSALECLFSAKNMTRKPVFEISDIVAEYWEQLDNETCMAIIENKEKLEEVFSSIPQTLNKGKDYISTAIVFKNRPEAKPGELIDYFETMSEYDLSSMLAWFECEPEIRLEVLNRLNNSDTLAKYQEKYFLAIIPGKELLKKFDIISGYEKNGQPLDGLLKTPQDLLDKAYKADNVTKGLQRLKSLPPAVFNDIKCTNLGDIIVHFETLKDIGNIKQQITLDDYIWLAENSGLLDDGLKEEFVNSDFIFGLLPITDDEKKIFKQNSALLNQIYSKDITLSGSEIFNLLLNPNAFNNLHKVEKILEEDLDSIIKELGYKCHNTNPVFADIVKKFLQTKENLPALVAIPDINKDTIIENFFQVSKIRPAISKSPEKYLNDAKDKYSDLELCFLQKYLELGNRDEVAAKKFLDSLDVETRDKFYIVNRSIDYNNNYYMQLLFNAVSVTDGEYINMLLSKRLNKFRQRAGDMQNLSYESKYFINKLIRHGKNRNSSGKIIKLSGKQKQLIVDYIPIMQRTVSDDLSSIINSYCEPVGRNGDFVFNLNDFLEGYSRIVFEKLGYTSGKYEKYYDSLKEWDRNNIHHILSPNSRDKGELKLLFDLQTTGGFNEYILNPQTPHGKDNNMTGRIFSNLGLDYKRWLEGIKPEKINCAGKDYTIGLIDRSAKNMVFMGNYTSCCTALGEEKGDSVPNYLLNTAFNIIGVKDEQGEIAATSRIFVSNNFQDEPFLVIDNIEISNKFRSSLSKDDSIKFAQEVWNYINKFAQSLSDNHTPVYMSHKYPKIFLPERPVISSRIKLAGATTRPELYINTIGDYVITKDSYGCELINIFNEP